MTLWVELASHGEWDPAAAGEERGLGGCRELDREMSWAVDVFCVVEHFSLTS